MGSVVGHDERDKVREMSLAVAGVEGQVVDGGWALVLPAARFEGQAFEQGFWAGEEQEREGHDLALVGVVMAEEDAVNVVEGVLVQDGDDEAEEGARDEEEWVERAVWGDGMEDELEAFFGEGIHLGMRQGGGCEW